KIVPKRNGQAARSVEFYIGHLCRQWPAQTRSLEPFEHRPNRRRRHANATCNRAGRYAAKQLEPKDFAHLAHARSLRRHSPLQQAKEQDLSRPAEAPGTRGTSSRNGGRNHSGAVGEIISEWGWASSMGGLPGISSVPYHHEALELSADPPQR